MDMMSFKDHVDVGDHNSARRFLVCFLYLNDVQEGGQQIFQNWNFQLPLNVVECFVPTYLDVSSCGSTS